MKLRTRLAALSLALLSAPIASAATPDPAKTLDYIHHAWSTLTRRMDDCSAFGKGPGDTRLAVYLPQQLPMPADLPRIAKACHVEVRRLPRPIRRIGEFDPATLSVQGLLYLPHPYVVPGGFFNEMYGWDSYFIELGLLADHRETLARDMVVEVEHSTLGPVKTIGLPVKFSQTPGKVRSGAPIYGEHTREVLRQHGFDDQEIDALVKDKAVFAAQDAEKAGQQVA